MKKFVLLFALALFACMATPVLADAAPSYAVANVMATTAVDVAGNAAAVDDVGVQAANNSNTKELTQYAWKAKTGAGVINTAGLVGLNQIGSNYRLPLLEVGWRA